MGAELEACPELMIRREAVRRGDAVPAPHHPPGPPERAVPYPHLEPAVQLLRRVPRCEPREEVRGGGERHGIRKGAARAHIERPAVRLRGVEVRLLVRDRRAERGPTSPQRHAPGRAERLRVVCNRPGIGVGAERCAYQIADPHAAVHEPHLTERPHAYPCGREHPRSADGRGRLDYFEREARTLRDRRLGGIPERGGPARTEGGGQGQRRRGDAPELRAGGPLGPQRRRGEPRQEQGDALHGERAAT